MEADHADQDQSAREDRESQAGGEDQEGSSQKGRPQAHGVLSRMSNEVVTRLEPQTEPTLALERWRAAAEAYKAGYDKLDLAGEKLRARLDTTISKLASATAGLEHARADAIRQHRLGYLEARWRYALIGIGSGILLTLGVGELTARFEVARQERAVAVGNDAFGRGLAVGAVQSQADDDAGVAKRNEPASAPP